MLYLGFTLGLFGSLHCIGMCGPLAIAFCNKPNQNKKQKLINALQYNLGRTTTYTLLGIVFGLIGSFLFIVDLQKYLSIFIGAVLILSVLFTFNLESRLYKFKPLNKFNSFIQKSISKLLSKAHNKSTFMLGMVNGLLPCGLVYLAIAGSIASTSILEGAMFMMLFGFGTIPALFFLILGSQSISLKYRSYFRKVLPVVNLIFGCFLIYRGFAIDVPESLNFWEAIKNPVMCH